MQKNRYNLITILGPTAVGKTGLAARLASEFGGAVISADSRQVYRHMDIGTGKDLKEYIINGVPVPYYLIDIIDPSEEFNLFLYIKNFYNIFRSVNEQELVPFLTGGTGLYLDAILNNYSLKEVSDPEAAGRLQNLELDELKARLLSLDPRLHNTTDLLDKDRIIQRLLIEEARAANLSVMKEEIKPLVIGITLERGEIKKRITARLKERLQGGMIDEIKGLLDMGISFEKLNFFGLEYRYAGMYLKGELNYNDMFQKLNSSIHDFAKRQMTWFRKMERSGIHIHWIEGADQVKASLIIKQNYFRHDQ